MIKHIIAILLMSCLYFTQNYGQKVYTPTFADPLLDKYRWRHCKELSGKNFTCFCEQGNGIMWYGIENGIKSYDGYKWTEYLFPKNNNKIGKLGSMVFCGDTLFIGGEYGIQTFINGEFSKIKFYGNSEKPMVFEDMKGQGRIIFRELKYSNDVILGTSSFGIYIRKNGWDHYYCSKEVLNRWDTISRDIKFHTLAPLGNGVKYFLTNILDCGDNTYYGFLTSNTIKKQFFKFRITNNIKNPIEIIEDNIIGDVKIGGPTTSVKRPNGEIWVGSESNTFGLNILRNNKWEYFSFKENLNDSEVSGEIINMYDGSVLITSFGLIYRYYNNQWTKITSPIITFKTKHVYAKLTQSGYLWLGDEKGEVYRIDYSPKHWTIYKGLNYQFTNSDSSLWFISIDNKVVFKKANSWYYYDKTDGLLSDPQTLYLSKNGTIWCGGSNKQVAATAYLKNNKWNMQVHPTLSWGIHHNAVGEDQKGNIWFGGIASPKLRKGQFGGGIKIHPGIENVEIDHFFKRGHPIIYSFAIGDSNKLYVGTEHGLRNVKDISSTTINFDRTQYSRLSRTASGIIWAATNRKGVIKLIDGKEDTVFTKIQGLASNVIYDVYAENDNSVWAATNEGYSYFNGNYWINNIYPEEFNKEIESGKLSGVANNIWLSKFPLNWIGRAINNLIFNHTNENFYSVLYKRDTNLPETEITLSFNKIASTGNTNIEWTGIDYMDHTSKEELLYSYRLNYQEWSIPASKININLIGLNPGDYVFEVKAIDKDANEDTTPAKVEFNVARPVWQQAWFILMIVTFVAIIIFLVVRIIRRNKKLAVLNQNLELSKSEILQQNEEILQKNEEIHQMKLRFFTNISHEFRTPLSLIVAPLEEITKANNLDNNQKYLFGIIHRNVKHLLQLVNELMDFQKIENDKFKLKISKGNILETINNVVSDFNLQAKSQNIKLIVNSNEAIDSEHWFDQGIIDRVLTNLLSNAFKFTPKGGKIKIDINRKNDLVNITVTDNGTGISKDKIDLVFERYYSDSSNSNQLNTGTGIGLSMCKRLIEIHKGNISVESEENKGTTFNVELLVSKENYNKEDIIITTSLKNISEVISDNFVVENTSENAKEEYPNVRDENILMLIVEDNNELREYLSNHFSYYKIMMAKNGVEAFDIALESIPDIIISDLMMPIMDGLQLCQKIKTTYLTSHIPLILLTAKANIENQIEGLKIGADAYISKPFNLQYLDIQVQNLIQQRKLLREKFSTYTENKFAEIKVSKPNSEFFDKVEKIINEKMKDPEFTANSLAEILCISRRQLDRKFQAVTDNTPTDFIRIKRLMFSAELITQQKYTMSQIVRESGFLNFEYFYISFKKHFGKTPKEYENEL